MSVIGSAVLAGASGQAVEQYVIERSLRFGRSTEARLTRTFGTATDQDVFTLSMWVKRAELGSTQHLFGVSTDHSLNFTSGDALNLTFGGTSALTTTELLRDPGAWYHIVWRQNGTSHTLYVNNVSVGTATATSSVFNTAVAHQIGARNSSDYFDGYLADIHFIDGQALTPTSFGRSVSGVWQPKSYTASHGANGFHLKFDTATNTTTIAQDDTSNNNDFTASNISVTSGTEYDSMRDTPTNSDASSGNNIGNYATLNPLREGTGTLSDANLRHATPTNDNGFRAANFGMSSGKWYWEVKWHSGSFAAVGLADAVNPTGNGTIIGYSSTSYAYMYNGKKINNSTQADYGDSLSTGDIVGVAFDADNGTLEFYLNGTSQGQAYTGVTSGPYFAACSDFNGSTSAVFIFNFGQRPFSYTPPTGFKSCCTQNLSNETVTTSGSYTGDSDADGPFVFLNGVPTTMTIGGTAVNFGTDVDRLSNGFKIRSSTVNNTSGTSYSFSVTAAGDAFKTSRAQTN